MNKILSESLEELVISYIEPKVYLHHSDRGVDFGRQWQVDLVLIAVDAHTHSFL